MAYQIAADLVVLVHFAFIVFVLIGGFLAHRWRWILWLHIPAAIWGTLAITMRWVCPLTPLENYLRQASGGETYTGGFIGRYLVSLVYPTGFDREVFVVIGIAVVVINIIAYTTLAYRRN